MPNGKILRAGSSLDESAFEETFAMPNSPLYQEQTREPEVVEEPEGENLPVTNADAEQIRRMARNEPAGALALLSVFHGRAKQSGSALEALDPVKTSETELRLTLQLFQERKNNYQWLKGLIEVDRD